MASSSCTRVVQQQGGHIEHITLWISSSKTSKCWNCSNRVNIWCFLVYMTLYWRSWQGCHFFGTPCSCFKPVSSSNTLPLYTGIAVFRVAAGSSTLISRRHGRRQLRFSRRALLEIGEKPDRPMTRAGRSGYRICSAAVLRGVTSRYIDLDSTRIYDCEQTWHDTNTEWLYSVHVTDCSQCMCF